jgi:hypothetical protein
MNYQPPKALQAQSKNRAIKPAIQNTSVSPNLLIFGVNLFPVFLSNERFVFRTRVLLRNRIYVKYLEYLTCIVQQLSFPPRTCGKIKPLDVAAKGVKSATMLEDFASEVEYLIDTTSKVREQKQKRKVTWDLSTDSGSSKNQEPYLCDQNRTDSAKRIYQLIAERQ